MKGLREVGRDRKPWEGIGRDSERCGGTGRGGKGQGAVRMDWERCEGIARGGEGQGAVGRGREQWGGIEGTFLPSPFLHSVNGACVLAHGDLNC